MFLQSRSTSVHIRAAFTSSFCILLLLIKLLLNIVELLLFNIVENKLKKLISQLVSKSARWLLTIQNRHLSFGHCDHEGVSHCQAYYSVCLRLTEFTHHTEIISYRLSEMTQKTETDPIVE